MKTFLISLLLLESLGIFCMAAEKNYQDAIFMASHCEGTDIAIEETMYQYGFNIEACNPAEPSMSEKISALINK